MISVQLLGTTYFSFISTKFAITKFSCKGKPNAYNLSEYSFGHLEMNGLCLDSQQNNHQDPVHKIYPIHFEHLQGDPSTLRIVHS